MGCSNRGEHLQAGPAGGARRLAAHQADGRPAQGPGDSAGGGIAQGGCRRGLLHAALRPLPHLRWHLPPKLWAQGHAQLLYLHALLFFENMNSFRNGNGSNYIYTVVDDFNFVPFQSFLIVSDPVIAKHILRDNSKAYSKV